MKRKFWEIFKDEDRHLFEILGVSEDDTLLTNRTAEMLEYDIYVQCDTPPANTPRESLFRTFEGYGYKHQEGLFRERLSELQARKIQGRKKHVRERWKK